MRQLLLLRHAKSSWDDKELPDHERPLNPRGRRAAQAIRAAMGDLGLVPDLVLVSTALRTRQTMQALEPWSDTPLIEAEERLYNASLQDLLDVLHGVAETVRSVLVIAHNPGLHELAMSLVGAHAMTFADASLRQLAEGYPSGALAEFTLPGPWRSLGEGCGGWCASLSARPARRRMIAATLEFTLAPEDLGALAHHDGLARAAASRTASVVCYDDAEATLASGGAILVQRERLWRLVRLAPGRDADWPACGPAPVIAEGAAPADLLPNLLEPVAVAALDGERLGYHHGEVALDVLHGTFRGGAYARPSCRLRLEGPADALAEVVPALSDLRLAVPRASLEQEAIAAAQGRELPPRHLGAPALPPDIAVGDGFAAITTHLLDALLFWVDR